MSDVFGVEEEPSDETPAEREARLATEIALDPVTQEFVDTLVDKLVLFTNHLSGHPFYPYQEPFARRLFESLIIGDGALITALFSRQSGKSETVANCVATGMIMLPRLAKAYPALLEKFKEGLWVGAFAPVDEQADTLHGRIVTRLTSERAMQVMADPEISERITAQGRVLRLSCGSEVRKTTAHPRASIEGRTYHLILIDECQGADNTVVNKSILPMATKTKGTKVFTGTPSYTKNVFYNTIQQNKRKLTRRGVLRTNHFEADWVEVGKHNREYKEAVQLEMLRLGEDSDEFRLSYKIQWLLEKGMFVTGGRLEELGDDTMNGLVREYHRTPIVVGIDCGRKQDRTIVTAVFVDWDHPDQFGYFHHRVLNWLDLEGQDWEEQYFRIMDFLRSYSVWKVGIDTNGLGDVVAGRLRRLMPDIEFMDLGSSKGEQSVRWKYLRELLGRGMISWPAGSAVRQTKVWRRFRQEMEDLEIEFNGPYVIGKAPKAADAHDDYPDSLSMACILSVQEEEQHVEQSSNFLYGKPNRRELE
jgi:hypothetical protein